jgi:peptidoglycan/LPS O-acetylase OafA/YrhL
MTDKKIGSLTGIRGFAALIVVIAHISEVGFFKSSPWHLGEVGVMVFFALSGFLMAYLYLEKPFGIGGAARYIVSRASRILPAYLFVVMASFLICMFIDKEFIYKITGANLLRHLFLSGNVSALWSIPPEVQFYGMFLLLWWSVNRVIRKQKVGGLLAVTAAIAVMIFYRASLPGTFVGSKVHFFAAGVVAGYMRAAWTLTKTSAKWMAMLQVASLVAIVAALAAVDADSLLGAKKDFYTNLVAPILSAMFILIFSYASAICRFLFENPVVTVCGEWSFSIYLLNLPVIYVFQKLAVGTPSAVQVPAMIAVILLLAWANFRFVEMPGAHAVKRMGGRIIGAKAAPVGVM